MKKTVTIGQLKLALDDVPVAQMTRAQMAAELERIKEWAARHNAQITSQAQTISEQMLSVISEQMQSLMQSQSYAAQSHAQMLAAQIAQMYELPAWVESIPWPILRELAKPLEWAPTKGADTKFSDWSMAWDYACDKRAWADWYAMIAAGADPNAIADRAAELMREHAAEVRGMLRDSLRETLAGTEHAEKFRLLDTKDSAEPVIAKPVDVADAAAWVEAVAGSAKRWRDELRGWKVDGRYHVLAVEVSAPRQAALSRRIVETGRLSIGRRGQLLDERLRPCGMVNAEVLNAALRVESLSSVSAQRLVSYLALEVASVTTPFNQFPGVTFRGGAEAMQKTYKLGGPSTNRRAHFLEILEAGEHVLFDFAGKRFYNLWTYTEKPNGDIVVFPGAALAPGFVGQLPKGAADRCLVPVLDKREFALVLSARMNAAELRLLDLLLLAMVDHADKDGWITGIEWGERSKLTPAQIEQVLAGWSAGGAMRHIERDGDRLRLATRHLAAARFIADGRERREQSRLAGKAAAKSRGRRKSAP